VLTGGFVQTATGFGFALVAAPALTATVGPVAAVRPSPCSVRS
jgi:uncharacterized membrane protein YfcA